jgi:hypothetical protein
MSTSTIENAKIVLRDEWLAARKKLVASVCFKKTKEK